MWTLLLSVSLAHCSLLWFQWVGAGGGGEATNWPPCGQVPGKDSQQQVGPLVFMCLGAWHLDQFCSRALPGANKWALILHDSPNGCSEDSSQ